MFTKNTSFNPKNEVDGDFAAPWERQSPYWLSIVIPRTKRCRYGDRRSQAWRQLQRPGQNLLQLRNPSLVTWPGQEALFSDLSAVADVFELELRRRQGVSSQIGGHEVRRQFGIAAGKPVDGLAFPLHLAEPDVLAFAELPDSLE